MIVNTKALQEITNKILPAVDTSELSKMSETLELEVQDKSLFISVTNHEYFVTVRLNLGYDEDLHAAVNASTFLNLISQITTEDIEMKCNDKSLTVIANGHYNLPLIYEEDKMLTLPRINIENPMLNMNIESSILHSILKYNSKVLQVPIVGNPLQRLYYVSEKGAITFTNGACVNEFTLEKPVKMLLSNKIVKLFKLFSSEHVAFTMGRDPFRGSSREISQTKVSFQDDIVTLTAILQCDDSMINKMPEEQIVTRAKSIYPYSININKKSLIQAIDRLMLLENKVDKSFKWATFKFNEKELKITDSKEANYETILYTEEVENLKDTEYVARFDLKDFKDTLSTCDETYLTLRFGETAVGNLRSLVIARTNIFNIIPEV